MNLKKSLSSFRHFLGASVLSFAFLISSNAFGYEPIRNVKDLKVKGTWEKVYRVKTARVIDFNYDLFRTDKKVNWTNEQIDKWILDNFAYISEHQIKKGEKRGVNTHIDYDPKDFKMAYRPPTYGRALVYEADGFLIDGKGAGSPNPQMGGHDNGLAPLGEMLRERQSSDLVADIAKREGGKFDVVQCYGSIDWGFDIIADLNHLNDPFNDFTAEAADAMRERLKIKVPDAPELKVKARTPAGMVLRQAHDRTKSGGPMGYANGQMPDRDAVMIENILNKYGLTSGSARQTDGDPVLGDYTIVNVQGKGRTKTKPPAMVDFGSITPINKNHRAIYSYGQLHQIDADPHSVKALVPHNKLVQPDPHLRVPYNLWGKFFPVRGFDFADTPRVYNDWFVFKWRKGLANRGHLVKLRAKLFEPVYNRWKAFDSGKINKTINSACWLGTIAKVGTLVPLAALPYGIYQYKKDHEFSPEKVHPILGH